MQAIFLFKKSSCKLSHIAGILNLPEIFFFTREFYVGFLFSSEIFKNWYYTTNKASPIHPSNWIFVNYQLCSYFDYSVRNIELPFKTTLPLCILYLLHIRFWFNQIETSMETPVHFEYWESWLTGPKFSKLANKAWFCHSIFTCLYGLSLVPFHSPPPPCPASSTDSLPPCPPSTSLHFCLLITCVLPSFIFPTSLTFLPYLPLSPSNFMTYTLSSKLCEYTVHIHVHNFKFCL